MSSRSAMGARAFANTIASVIAFSTVLQAQPAASSGALRGATTPAACTNEINSWRTAQVLPALIAYRAATDSNRADLQKKYVDASNSAIVNGQRMSADCAAKFSVASIPPSQLMELVKLYTAARDTTNARIGTERLLSEKSLPPRTRAQALVVFMNQAIASQSDVFGILDQAELEIAKIDALPDSLSDIKLNAHMEMLSRYEYLDVAEGLQNHATAVIALARAMKLPQGMVSGYSSLARSFADRLQPDSALKILDTGEKEIGAVATERFRDFRNRYELIGKRAPVIEASWWINTPEAKVVTPQEGNVTLIEFTAHWCGPCKNSYPGLRSLTERLKGKAFTGVMVTQLYGYLGTQKNLSEAQEIAADKEYFGKEHAVPFPVAINPQIKETGTSFVQPKPDMDYRVGGIPQIMIVDKRGIIRQIVTGWDQGNTERFSAYIDRLLAEK